MNTNTFAVICFHIIETVQKLSNILHLTRFISTVLTRAPQQTIYVNKTDLCMKYSYLCYYRINEICDPGAQNQS